MDPQKATVRRYFETLRHLEPEQLRYQLWRPLQPYLWPRPRRIPQHVTVRPEWGMQVRRPRRPADPRVLEGVFRFWGIERQLDMEREWIAEDLGSSWNFPVHYFDQAASLASAEDLPAGRADSIRDQMSQWMEQHHVERGDPWHPYTTSLRVVNWLDVIASLHATSETEWTDAVLHSVYRQATSIPAQIERHLLGTHLLKNLTAILIAGSVFDDRALQKMRHQALGLLQRELRAQVCDDGGHVEPSVMYHCMATGDLLDLLNFKEALPADVAEETRQVACRMVAYATNVATPQNDYPLQGDSWRGGEWTPAQLQRYAGRLGLEVPVAREGLTFLKDSGVAVWRHGRQWLFADVAPVGPPHLPSHGHCDSLSFEWRVDGQSVLVDAGTFSYEDGAARHDCRSTQAHNTLQIDGQELHEIWSRFRVARRSAVQATQVESNQVEALLIPWFANRLRVQRRFTFGAEEILIEDTVEGSGEHEVVSRLHLHPECQVSQEGSAVTVRRGSLTAVLSWEGGTVDVLSSGSSGSHYADEPGQLVGNPVVVLQHRGALPFHSRLKLQVL